MNISNAMAFTLVTILITFPKIILAAPPQWVYRLDFRPPQEIYNNGFQSSGSNFNPMQHATGGSCVNPNSNTVNMQTGFINTVTNINALQRAAVGMIERDPQHRVMYIYNVRADSNFYPLAPTLSAYDTQHNTLSPVNAHQEATVMGTHITQNNIPAGNILGYRRVTFNGRGIVDTDITYGNNNYIAVQTTANPNPYLTGFIGDTRRFFGTLRALLNPMLSACNIASGLHRDELRSAQEAYPSYLHFFVSESLPD